MNAMNQSSTSQNESPISHEDISRRAEELWRGYGSPQGRDEEIWLEAEKQLRAQSQARNVPTSENVATSLPTSQRLGEPANSAPPRIPSQEAELMEKNANSTPPIPSRSKARAGKNRS